MELTSPPAKATLLILFMRACVDCGFAFPGVEDLCRCTGLKRRAVSVSLKHLRQIGAVQVQGYSTGGRGMSTQYVVLPDLVELSTAPCGKCLENMKKCARGALYFTSEENNRARGALYDESVTKSGQKPRTKRHENRAPRAHQEVAIKEARESTHARERAVDPPAAPPGAAVPPLRSTPPTPTDLRPEAIRQLEAFRALNPEPETGETG